MLHLKWENDRWSFVHIGAFLRLEVVISRNFSLKRYANFKCTLFVFIRSKYVTLTSDVNSSEMFLLHGDRLFIESIFLKPTLKVPIAFNHDFRRAIEKQ